MTVQRADLENKLREIQQVVDETASGARNPAVLAGIGVVLVILFAYLLGRRKGRSAAARVEVYRVR